MSTDGTGNLHSDTTGRFEGRAAHHAELVLTRDAGTPLEAAQQFLADHADTLMIRNRNNASGYASTPVHLPLSKMKVKSHARNNCFRVSQALIHQFTPEELGADETEPIESQVWFTQHCAVLCRRGDKEWVVDFTASQFGVKDFPYVGTVEEWLEDLSADGYGAKANRVPFGGY
ncbi:hypothetical protein [Leifsonia sp. Leaf264]|uniref:hypothetical protein n=1 Tax=Leifsonia sp. Leaf264 TaxID=1736314 RepID=UPI0006FD82A3|nr:hypothetical protein [Leifsonia sp. Leaf264]KQO98283.1 hypothetical protein ASF30_09495 [Leifsonia sp. Leaf264]